VVDLVVVTAVHQAPDELGDAVRDETDAAVGEGDVDPAGVLAAGLHLPVGPVVRQVVVGATHAQLAQPGVADAERLSDGVAVLNTVGVLVPVVGGGGAAGRQGPRDAPASGHRPRAAAIDGD